MLSNYVRITVYADKFDMWPPCPQVVAAAEPFKVGVFWESGSEIWERVTVKDFLCEDGTVPQTINSATVFERIENNVVKDIDFLYLQSKDQCCKYTLVFKREGSSETLTIDPTVILKKLA